MVEEKEKNINVIVLDESEESQEGLHHEMEEEKQGKTQRECEVSVFLERRSRTQQLRIPLSDSSKKIKKTRSDFLTKKRSGNEARGTKGKERNQKEGDKPIDGDPQKNLKLKETLFHEKKQRNEDKENISPNHQMNQRLNELDIPKPQSDPFSSSLSLENSVSLGGLSIQELNRFPELSFGKNRLEKIQSECLICLDEFKKREMVLMLPCIHLYHEKCIGDWMKNHSTCPFCNFNVRVVF